MGGCATAQQTRLDSLSSTARPKPLCRSACFSVCKKHDAGSGSAVRFTAEWTGMPPSRRAPSGTGLRAARGSARCAERWELGAAASRRSSDPLPRKWLLLAARGWAGPGVPVRVCPPWRGLGARCRGRAAGVRSGLARLCHQNACSHTHGARTACVPVSLLRDCLTFGCRCKTCEQREPPVPEVHPRSSRWGAVHEPPAFTQQGGRCTTRCKDGVVGSGGASRWAVPALRLRCCLAGSLTGAINAGAEGTRHVDRAARAAPRDHPHGARTAPIGSEGGGAGPRP